MHKRILVPVHGSAPTRQRPRLLRWATVTLLLMLAAVAVGRD